MAILSVIVPFVLNETITLTFSYEKDGEEKEYIENFKTCHLYKEFNVSDETEG